MRKDERQGSKTCAKYPQKLARTKQRFASVGAAVGAAVGSAVGAAVGAAVGTSLGAAVGTTVGAAVGTSVGAAVGLDVPKHDVVLAPFVTKPSKQGQVYS